MRQSYSLIIMSALLALVLIPAPARAAQDAGQAQVAAQGQDDLGLYLNADQLVETASRYPKPLSQVAENVTVITAEEIEAQHAHTLGEVLGQIPGLFITGDGQDVGSLFDIHTQGSEISHTLVLIDGVRLNTPGAGVAYLNGLPLGIIKRIEIIQGPVSSAWGSSLGGVVNIITKDAGKGQRPSGQATATVGERGTTEVNGQAGGVIGPVGYYLYGGRQESDGHVQDYGFDNHPLYAKLSLPLPRLTLGATIGYSDPFGKTVNIPTRDETENVLNRTTFTTAYMDAPLASEFNFHLALSRFSQKFYREDSSLGIDPTTPAGTLQWDDTFEDQSDNLDARLSWNGNKGSSAVIGFESERGRLDFTEEWPVSVFTSIPRALEERRAYYTNASFTWGRLTLSPGLRYDYISTTDDSLSPSLGAAYRLDTDTILRASVARGFNAPYLEQLIKSFYGNPNLAPEHVDSVQAGVETVAVPYLRLSANLFHDRVTDVWNSDTGTMENEGISRRHGVELEADTKPWHRLSLNASAAMVSTDSETQDGDTMYAANLITRYDNPELLSVRLGGRYIWWDKALRQDDGKFNDFIWDLALSREVYHGKDLQAELFGVIRNLFNGSQYWISNYANPDRWLEAGVTVKY
jgi:vitamin B12 transporter